MGRFSDLLMPEHAYAIEVVYGGFQQEQFPSGPAVTSTVPGTIV